MDQVWYQVGNRVMNPVWDLVLDQVWFNVKNRIRNQTGINNV
jgi:hypothetical protein